MWHNGTAVYALSTEGNKKPELLVDTPCGEDQNQVSPDGRWIAYNADESGSWEVYVAAFPTFSQKRQVSSGGVQPLWRKDGKELFYLNPEGKVMVVTVSPGAELETGPPKVLFATNLQVTSVLSQYAVTGDGQRFLFVEPVAQQLADSFNVILNWPAILSQLRR